MNASSIVPGFNRLAAPSSPCPLQRNRQRMLTGFAALFLALAAGTAGTLWRNLGATQQRDHQELARLASAVEIQASQLLETADTALANLAASLVKDPHALAAFEELQTHYLRSLPFLLGLSLVDQHGLVKASTNAADSGMQVDLRRLAPTLPQSDRMAIAPRAQGRSLIESHPTAAPGPGFIPLVRRVQLPDSKAMLLVALLDSDALTGYQLQLLDTSPKDTRVQLALEDGSLLTQAGGHTRYQRHSFRAPSLPRDNLPEASQEWYGPLETADGLRLGAMQRATSLPLVSVVERPYPSTLQRSWLALRTPLALMLPALSLIALLSLIA